MKQDFEVTRKAVETPLRFTHSVMERSKELRNPSPKAKRIGTAIGGWIRASLLLTGGVQAVIGKPLWAVGTMATGALTVISNRYQRKKNEP